MNTKHPGLVKLCEQGRYASDPASRLRAEMAVARALADEVPACRAEWLAYARGIENALRVLGHRVEP